MAEDTEEEVVDAEAAEESDDASYYKCRGKKCKYQAKVAWEGPCPRCGIWFNAVKRGREHDKRTSLDEIPDEPTAYISTNIPEFDLVLGGGLVTGSAVALYGPPGTGKSTLFMMTCAGFAADRKRCLYASAEETNKDIGKIAHRLGIPSEHRKRIAPLGEAEDFEQIMEACAEKKPHLAVIDSISTLTRADTGGSEGSNEQIKALVQGFTWYGKKYGTIFLIVFQVNAAGGAAGARTAIHAVDTVINFDRYVDNDNFDNDGEVIEGAPDIRILTSEKNRNGKEGVTAKMEMTDKGLIPVKRKSKLYSV